MRKRRGEQPTVRYPAFIFRNNRKMTTCAIRHFCRAFPNVPARNQYGPRGVFKLNHGQLRRGPIKHERRVPEDLRDCDEGGWEGTGTRDTKSVHGTPGSAWRFIFLRCMCIIIIMPFVLSPVAISSAPSRRPPLRNASCSGAPARKNFAGERLAVLLANYSDTVYDSALRCIVQ